MFAANWTIAAFVNGSGAEYVWCIRFWEK
jgi:hypothetical protein